MVKDALPFETKSRCVKFGTREIDSSSFYKVRRGTISFCRPDFGKSKWKILVE